MGDRDGTAAGEASSAGRRSPVRGEGTGRVAPVGWTKHGISEEEVDTLRQHFSKMLELPGDRIRTARLNWRKLAVIVRSVGRRVPAEWVAKDVGSRGRLRYEVEAFPIAEDHLVLRFQSEEDRNAALAGGPWFVAGQLLAMEPWRPDFVPGPDMVRDTVVWLRLPKLPLEFWDEESIKSIAAEAGRPLAVDDVTGQLKKVGFARVKVVINSAEPLMPGVQIRGENRIFWQPFVYENLPCFCYNCGRIGHELSGCTHTTPLPEVEEGRRTMPMVVETVETLDRMGAVPEGGTSSSGRQPVYGPWLATTRIRVPRPAKTSPPLKKTTADNTGSARPGGSKVTTSNLSSPDSPPDPAGWQKPAKLARRRSPPKTLQQDGGQASASVFTPLSQDDPLEVDHQLGSGDPVAGPEVVMGVPRSSMQHLKRSRSPVRRDRKGEREAKGEGKEPEGSCSKGKGTDSVQSTLGRRLPESWKIFMPGHSTVQTTPEASLATAKMSLPPEAGRHGDGEVYQTAATTLHSGHTTPAAGEEAEASGAHALAVRQAKSAVGLMEAGESEGEGPSAVEEGSQAPTETGVFTFHGVSKGDPKAADEELEKKGPTTDMRRSRVVGRGAHSLSPRT